MLLLLFVLHLAYLSLHSLPELFHHFDLSPDKKGIGRYELALSRNIPVARDATTCSRSDMDSQDSLCNGRIFETDTFTSEKESRWFKSEPWTHPAN